MNVPILLTIRGDLIKTHNNILPEHKRVWDRWTALIIFTLPFPIFSPDVFQMRVSVGLLIFLSLTFIQFVICWSLDALVHYFYNEVLRKWNSARPQKTELIPPKI